MTDDIPIEIELGPMFADEQANSVSDDAAESVRDQIVQFLHSLKGETDDA